MLPPRLIARLIALGTLLIALGGCSTVRYVPMETTRNLYHTLHTSDTIRIRDSTIIDRTGDTIRQTRWRDRWHTTTLRDTVIIRDTIPYPVEVPTRLSRWEQLKIDLGGWALAVLALTLALIALRRSIPRRP